MKKQTYYLGRLEISKNSIRKVYTGETKDLYFAEDEKIPHTIMGNLDNYGKPKSSKSSSYGYGAAYSSQYEATFGNN